MCPIYNIGKSAKRMGDRMRFVTFRVNCFVWAGRENGEPLRSFGFASDISESGAGVFLDVKLAKGTPVRIAFEEESNTAHVGVAAWCRRYTLDQRFHAQTALDYRIGVQFFFESESDRQRWLMYFNDLRKRAAAVPNQFKF